jgi:hypothetical protein
MSSKNRKQVGTSASEVRQLFAPVIRFLQAAGISLDEFEAIVRDEFRRQLPRRSPGRVEHLATSVVDHCGVLIANWKTRPEFLSRNGYPRNLLLRGPNGFSHLAKISAPKLSVTAVLSVLLRFGAVKKTRSGRVRLMSKFFDCTHPANNLVAFEPNLQFLIDAAHVLDDQLGPRTKRSEAPARYWREVENPVVPMKYAREFITFSKRRAMALMEEIEDWLDQHASTTEQDRQGRHLRLGMGLFAIAERHRSEPAA